MVIVDMLTKILPVIIFDSIVGIVVRPDRRAASAADVDMVAEREMGEPKLPGDGLHGVTQFFARSNFGYLPKIRSRPVERAMHICTCFAPTGRPSLGNG